MNKILISLLAVIMLCSFGPTLYYDLSLSSVSRPAALTDPYGEKTVDSSAEDEGPVYTYEDDNISITWIFTQYQFEFILTNKSDNSITLNWDNMKYVGYNGMTYGIIHKGIYLYEKDNVFQVPTVVPSKATYSDCISPVNVNANATSVTGWKPGDFFPQGSSFRDNIDALRRASAQIRVRILFQVLIDGVPNDYTFEFKINDIKTSKK